ncbi:MAG: VOC family protein [Planctomycetota bacterium]
MSAPRPVRGAAAARVLLALLALLALAAGIAAQGVGTASPTAGPIEAGRKALAAGDAAAAVEHLLNALPFAPASPEILALLLEASATDADARALWLQAWYAARADADGRAKPDGTIRRLLAAEDPWPAKLAIARAAAVTELVDFAAKRAQKGERAPDELLVAQWGRRAALELARRSPALRATHGANLDPTLRVPGGFDGPVLRAVEREMRRALDNLRTGDAMRLARCLRGFVTQAGFKDLQGERPAGIERFGAAAGEGLARAREQLAARVGEPWTVEELEWLTQEEGEAFTREHDSFAFPGVAVSPRAWYRIETDCGYQTLLGVARTIELHHQRLANWFGQDPFVGRPGIVRVVPEAYGLESEGAPFWWAGGFQGGDETTMRFSCGTIEGLGHGLTHELTHRFDGAIYPGMPAWLVEGRAVWTGAAYGHSTDTGFVARHASFGTIEGTFIKGYGGLDKLTKLVDGTVEDYRDNYVAGYALYVYLNTWEEDGRLLYHDRLQSYMEDARHGGQDPVAFFTRHFGDGKDGRPDGFEAFAAAFGTYIAGFYWKNPQPWTALYTQDVPAGPSDGWVYDEPTWTWSRSRAEPTFGQDQAREAGLLLHALGREEEAVPALVWGLSQDGRTPGAERVLGPLLAGLKRGDAAWVVEHTLRFPDAPAANPAPFLRTLPRTRELLALLGEAATAYRTQGLIFAAGAMSGERDRLALLLGEKPLMDRSAAAATALHPFDEAERLMGLEGWTEEGLTGFEERRVTGLWYEDDHLDLHVGRDRPRTGTGKLDRAAHQRDAFVRTDDWLLPGVYRLRMRIQFTTSFVSGAVIVGYTRRDRSIRFHFSAGDFMYAIGESEEEPKFEEMGWSVAGLRDRDGPLPGSTRGGTFRFGRQVPAFDLEILVDGPTLLAFIDGERVGIYHTVDGAPIEGYVGFATGMGAIRVQAPTVQRLDSSRLAGRPAAAPASLNLALAAAPDFEDLENRSFLGLPPSPNGRLVLWIPVPWLDEGETLDLDSIVARAEMGAQTLHEGLYREGAPQPFVVVVPARIGEERLAALRDRLAAAFEKPPALLVHPFAGEIPPGMDDAPDRYKRWLLFVDSSDIVRVASPFLVQFGGFDDLLRHWLTVFRDHGRPERELPAVPRLGEEGEEGGDGDPVGKGDGDPRPSPPDRLRSGKRSGDSSIGWRSKIGRRIAAFARAGRIPPPHSRGDPMSQSPPQFPNAIALACQDMKKSVAFYRDKLGFVLKECWPDESKPLWANLVLDGQSVMLGAPLAEENIDKMCGGREAEAAWHRDSIRELVEHPPGAGMHIYLQVSDVDAFDKRIRKAGVKPGYTPVDRFYGLRDVGVRDPDGYRLVFYTPIKMETCQSCGMPLQEAQPGQMYCQYCTDEEGRLRSYGEVLEGTVTGYFMGMKNMPRKEAEAAARTHLAAMPAWKSGC